jgi:hypothetical protein
MRVRIEGQMLVYRVANYYAAVIKLLQKTFYPRGLRSKAGGRTEAFTARGGVVNSRSATTPPRNAEHAEGSMETSMLHLYDLCALCGKMLATRSQA